MQQEVRAEDEVVGAATVPPRNRTLILNDSSKKAAASSSSGTTSTNDTSYKPRHAEVSSSGSATYPSTSIANPSATGHFRRLDQTQVDPQHEPRQHLDIPTHRACPLSSDGSHTQGKGRSQSSSLLIRRQQKPPRSKVQKPLPRSAAATTWGKSSSTVSFSSSTPRHQARQETHPTLFASDTTQTSPQAAAEQSTAVPLKTSINGQEYIRTKRGNLISAELLAKRKAQREAQAKMGRLDKMVGQISAIQATRNTKVKPGSRTLDAKKARTLCTFFNKTGQCSAGCRVRICTIRAKSRCVRKFFGREGVRCPRARVRFRTR